MKDPSTLDPLTKATLAVTEESLKRAVLEKSKLPRQFSAFEEARNSVVDNAQMAALSFPGNNAERFRAIGRITGYIKEFVAPVPASTVEPGTDIAVATAVHLFGSKEAVARWMSEVFLKQFERHVGEMASQEHRLVSVERLAVTGFHDETASLKVVQEGAQGVMSSTIVDFRIGRLLGVAFVVTTGDFDRRTLVQQIGIELERQIVRVALGSA